MSIVILGGFDRLKSFYKRIPKKMGMSVKVYSRTVPQLAHRISGVDGIIIFTDTVSHDLARFASRAADSGIHVVRSHSGSISALKRCLTTIRGQK